MHQYVEGENEKAQYNLALIYDNGIGVLQDFNKAVELYKLSAENGYPPAQNAYGWCFVVGKVVKQDLYQAVRWFRSAAKQGNMRAQYN